MQSTQMDTEWTEYQCKSGQTRFIYNKVTGEHKWPKQYNNVSLVLSLYSTYRSKLTSNAKLINAK